MTHTPRPWRLGDAGTTVFGPPTGAPAPQAIAYLVKGPNWRANARLIAAAPQLLEALQAFLHDDPHARTIAWAAIAAVEEE